MKKFIVFFSLIFSITVFCQQSYFELLRQDVATKKVALISEVMKFTNEEAEVIWPVYREFDFEKSKLDDELFKLIKDYAEHFQNLSDEKALELMNKNLSLQKQEIDLKQEYLNKFSQVIAPSRAVKLMQVINQIDQVLDLQISSQIPLVGEPIEYINETNSEEKGKDLR